MPTGMTPVLYDYFRTSADLLMAEYERSRGLRASANMGRNREAFCDLFLRRNLPPMVSVETGEIWDSTGHRTGQLDTIIVRNDAPVMHHGAANVYIAEGVFGVIEVKSNLNQAKLREALTTLRAVKALDLSASQTVFTFGEPLERPLRVVFSYESVSWTVIQRILTEPENQDIIDFICVLNRGLRLCSMPDMPVDGEPLLEAAESLPIPGRTAALGFFYAFLYNFLARFSARMISIGPYFEPLDAWMREE